MAYEDSLFIKISNGVVVPVNSEIENLANHEALAQRALIYHEGETVSGYAEACVCEVREHCATYTKMLDDFEISEKQYVPVDDVIFVKHEESVESKAPTDLVLHCAIT